MTERQTTIKAWDQIAAQLILRELAPKGFKESKDKNYKGMKVANVHSHFLNYKKVGKVQQISAQLVREFRGHLKTKLQKELETVKKIQEGNNQVVVELSWYKFGQRKMAAKQQAMLKARVETFEQIINELDYIDFK